MKFRHFLAPLAATFLLADTAAQTAATDDNPDSRTQTLSVTTLGTGTPRFSNERSRPAALVTFNGMKILVDAGTGTERRLHDAGIDPAQIDHLLITHHHIDHNAELPLLLVTGSVRQSLKTIAGPPGTSGYVQYLQDFYMEDMLYRTRRRNIGEQSLRNIDLHDMEGGEALELDGLKITTARVNHTIHTVAYRFEVEGDSIVISGDLSYSESLVELAKGADILVMDSGGMPSADGSGRQRTSPGNRRPQDRPQDRPGGDRPGRERAHGSVEDVARMANEAGAATLVLTHIGHDRVDEPQVRQRISAIYDGRVELASDGAFYPVGISPEPGKTAAPVAVVEGRFEDNGDGTVNDLDSGLQWQKSPDHDKNGVIDARDKMTRDQAAAGADKLQLGGHQDWRLPTIKELYSLIDFSGIDPSGYRGTDVSGLTPFIDTRYFDFAYGDTGRGERIIDAQFTSSTTYVSGTGPRDGETQFGVNFADGRIKGYGLDNPRGEKSFYVLYVRGESNIGSKELVDNGDNTVTDRSNGLMWTRKDSGKGMDWVQAQKWVEERNEAKHLGYSDWRLPTAKELQGIVDYSRSPSTTGSAAIDPVFEVSQVSNEAGQLDYPYFWTSDTHRNMSARPDGAAVYIAFGRAMGYMRNAWVDAHGAGAQRSDPKTGDPSRFPQGRGPQGDAIRIYNHIRLVRDVQ
jgi:ribonuclease BN (tRNA processing enzyme)